MSFLKKIFGFGGGKNGSGNPEIEEIIQSTMDSVIQLGGFDLEFDIRFEGEEYIVDLKGNDIELLTEKEGQLLDAFQFLMKRVGQHHLPEAKFEVVFDTDGYRERSSAALIELADRLKGIALERNKSVYFRALPPKDRKVIHQHLAQDERVKSKSVGDGLYKKIKVYPATMKSGRSKKGPRPDNREARDNRGNRDDNRGNRDDNRGNRSDSRDSRSNIPQ